MTTKLDAQQIIKALNLKPHPEGGFYTETYRSAQTIQQSALPTYYSGDRAASTCIFFLLTPDTFSTLHKLASDEIFHFYMGDPVEMLQLMPDGTSKVITLGTDLLADQQVQVLVPRNVWQGARVIAGGRYALLGCTVAPGFDFTDYIEGTRADLVKLYPGQQALISQLTRQ